MKLNFVYLLLVMIVNTVSFSLVRNLLTSYKICNTRTIIMSSDDKNRPGMKGYYRRPSKAIEKGGGFFIPGLEGSRIRFISAVSFILLVLINRQGVLTQFVTIHQVISETTAILSAMFLFFIGFLETVSINNNVDDMAYNNFLTDLQNKNSITDNDSTITNNPLRISKEIINSSDGITYVSLLSKSETTPNEVSIDVELGPVSSISITSEQSKILFDLFYQSLSLLNKNNDTNIVNISAFSSLQIPVNNKILNIFNDEENVLLYRQINKNNTNIWIIKSRSLINLNSNRDWIISLCDLLTIDN